MKCPKCGYLGFEHVDRCRNCGYDFSFTSAPALPDLSIRQAMPDNGGPLGDLSLLEPLDRASLDTLREPASGTRSGSRGVVTPSDLPLFDSSAQDDAPLITRLSPPRHPLAVRRATPEVARVRVEARSAPFDQPLPDLGEPASFYSRAAARVETTAKADSRPSRADEPAGIAARTFGGLIDVLVVLGIDLVVVYFTLQICGLSFDDLGILPKAPLAAFLTLLGVSYFVAFTMCGQTLGQMTAGIRVVADGSRYPPAAGGAVVRTAGWLLLLAPAGLGLFSVVLDEERRGLHDRVASTRVVRASV